MKNRLIGYLSENDGGNVRGKEEAQEGAEHSEEKDRKRTYSQREGASRPTAHPGHILSSRRRWAGAGRQEADDNCPPALEAA